ncbi:MAG: adenylate/guanylate cyclase domain-containing protein [Acidimicrobiia bacterium]
MICEACHTENPLGTRFCGNCGHPLSVSCPNCGHANPPDWRFCGQCGTALDVGSTPTEARTATAERRLVSVLFADLTGYTTFAENRDAEETRAFLGGYFEQSRVVIERFGGLVEKFIGDAVMAVWGAEATNEDDAERAVRAGLELVDLVAKLAAEAGTPDLALRVGVHTGEAAVGPSDDHMGFVTGDLVNTASRLQSVAAPGTVLVGPATHMAAQRAIAFEPMGTQSLKGKAVPIEAWRALRVVSERAGRGRGEALEPPFVGRSNELRLLKDLLGSVASESRVRLVSILGEAGIGKSRLVWEFQKYIDGLVETVYWHEGRSPAYGDGVTFWAVAEMIKSRAGIVDDDSDREALDRLDESLETWIADPADRAWMRPRVAAIIGVGEAPPGERSDLEAAVRMYFEAVAARGTTVLVFEDLHWADAAMVDFVQELTDWWRGLPILIVTMARSDLLDQHPTWSAARPGVVSVTLGPLSIPEMSTLIEGTVPGLPKDTVVAIAERAAGIPLYAVELMRGMLAAGDMEGGTDGYRFVGEAAQIAVPETLQAVIGARIDRLTKEDRDLIQDAAVLGQSFSTKGLAALTGRDVDDLEAHLRELSRREIVEPVRDRRSPELGQYRFLQGLIRDVTLGRMGRDSRRARHVAAAEYLDAQEDPELAVVVADHYLQALDASHDDERNAIRSRALGSLQRAVDRAADLKAHGQVLSISRSALQIADHDAERAVFWEAMLTAATRLADTPLAERLASEAMAHYRQEGDEASVTRVTRMLGFCYAENNHPERAVELLVPLIERHEDLASDPELARSAVILSRCTMLSSKPDLELMEHALTAVERLQLVPETVDGLITKGTFLGSMGRLTEARVLLEGAIALADQHGLAHAAARGRNNLGYVLIGTDVEAGLEASAEAYDSVLRQGDRSQLLFHSSQKASVLFTLGRFDELIDVLSDPLLEDPPPSIRVWHVSIHHDIACFQGDMEEAARLLVEIDRLAQDVDDVQVLGSVRDSHLISDLFSGQFEIAYHQALTSAETSWIDAFQVLAPGVLAGAVLGRDEYERMISVAESYHPRFLDETHFYRAALRLPDPSAVKETEEILAKWEALGLKVSLCLGRVTVAAAQPPGKIREDLMTTAKSMAEVEGWNGVIALIDLISAS